MNLPTPENERRLFLRRPIRTTARLFFSEGQSVEVTTCDISEGGLGVVAHMNLPIGLTFRVKLRIPDGQTDTTELDTTVTVARSILASYEGGFKIGLTFAAVDHTWLMAIKRFVNRT